MTASLPILSSNLLRQLIPLNTLLEDELIYLSQHSKITCLAAEQSIALQPIENKLYLLKGRVSLLNDGATFTTIEADSKAACSALNRSRSLALTLYTHSDAYLLWVDLTQLGQHNDDRPAQQPNFVAETPRKVQAVEKKIHPYSDKQLLNLGLFKSLPQQHSLAIIRQAKQLYQNKGVYVQRQNSKASHIYLILAGKAVEFQQQGQQKKLYRHLRRGDVFGHMALLSQQTQNTQVYLQHPSLLLQIPQQVFLHYSQYLNKSISQRHAREIMQKPQVLCIDVRSAAEYAENHLVPSIHVEYNDFLYAFTFLASKRPELNNQRAFIIYSNKQRRASAVAMQLRLQGIPSHVLQDGFKSFPLEYTASYQQMTAAKSATDIKQHHSVLFDEVEQLLTTEAITVNAAIDIRKNTELAQNHTALLKAQIADALHSAQQQNPSQSSGILSEKSAWIIAILLLLFGLTGLLLSPLGTAIINKLYPSGF